MKRIIYLLPLLLMACAPGKSGEVVRVDIYCDSCEALVRNSWYKGDDSKTETVFNGLVDDYYTLNVERYISDYPCVRTDISQNYTSDTTYIYLIQNGDTIYELQGGGAGFCY